jgi:integrase
MKFTDRYLQSLKPKDKDYRVRESHGFAVRVLPSGVKRFEYIYTINGKRRILHLGNYPYTKLAEARESYHAAASQTSNGVDPQEKPSPPPPLPEELTVQSLAETWLNEWSKVHHTPKWHNTLKLALGKDVFPAYGSRLVSEIRRRDAVAILEAKAANAPGQAKNLHKALRGMFGYALDREIVDFNPFAEIRAARVIPAMKQTSRDRHLSDDEIIKLWTAIDNGGGSDNTRRALKLILLTGQRPGEVTGMHSREIQIGIGRNRCKICRRCGWWTISPERRLGNKGGEHRVFLPTLAMELIGDQKGYVFPGDDSELPITENSVAYHVRREVKGTGKVPYYGFPRWTPHDLRRTCGTGVRRLGASRDNMDLILGHSVQGVTGVYDRYAGDREKEHWLSEWSEWLRKIVTIPSNAS